MPKYVKIPVVIEAKQWTGDNTTEIVDWVLASGVRSARWHEKVNVDVAADAGRPVSEHIAIDTLEGTMRANIGDFIIRGTAGEFYPCKPDIFIKIYSPVD